MWSELCVLVRYSPYNIHFLALQFLQSVAEAAEDLWDRYGFDFGTDFSGLYKALSHVNYNVRLAAAEALAAALEEYPDSIQVIVIVKFDWVINICTLLLFLINRNLLQPCFRCTYAMLVQRGVLMLGG